MSIEEIFLKYRNYSGPLWKLVLTGGGIGLADYATIPGASKFIDSVIVPYSTRAMSEYLQTDIDQLLTGTVSENRTQLILDCSSNEQDNYSVLVVNAALITNRWRNGPDHAYIYSDYLDLYVRFDKMEEATYNSCTELEIFQHRHLQNKYLTSIAGLIMFGEDIDYENNYLGSTITMLRSSPERKAQLFPDS